MSSPGSLRVAPIVEGHGERTAVPLLIRRIGVELLHLHTEVQQPWRLPKGKMTQSEVLTGVVGQVRRRLTSGGLVLVVVDADDDEPEDLRRRVETAATYEIACAVAVREYEAWLLAGLPASDAWTPAGCEQVADAKGRLAAVTGRRYRETVDQASITGRFDLSAAVGHSPSLARLVETLRNAPR